MDLKRELSATSAHDDSASSSYEKREGSAIEPHDDEEKRMGIMDGEEAEAPSKCRARSQDGRSLRTVQSHHSRAGGDGYTCFDPESTQCAGPPAATASGPVTEQQSPYLVSWDGDADPENPKSMNKLRRWAIVLICASSSLCVCFYLLIIWSGVQLCLIILFVPETYHPVLLRRKAIRLRKETGNPEWIAPIEKMDRSIARTVLWSCIRPFQLLFFEPMCLSLCILSAILLGILYLFFGAFPLVFGNNHGFSISQTGLAFLGLLVGMLTGVSSDPIWRRVYGRLVRQREQQGGQNGGSEPEFRLPSTIVGAWVVPVALFGKLSVVVQHLTRQLTVLMQGLGGRRIHRLLGTGNVDFVEQYPVYAASALAANSFARSYFAAAFPLFGVQMYNSKSSVEGVQRDERAVTNVDKDLGYQWATTVLAFLALAMAPFPILFFRYGKRLRAGSSKPRQPIAGKRICAHLQQSFHHSTHDHPPQSLPTAPTSTTPSVKAHAAKTCLLIYVCALAAAFFAPVVALALALALPRPATACRLRPSLPRAYPLHRPSLPSPCTTTSPYCLAPSLLATRSEDASAATATATY
ncbi:hypothetical protein yc1106_06898 [Curvularia clavata]|uniref:Uncharacterized protein n=1 Tax=Curvularia clavata TaxID=95742 RepID=A0A9Q8ZDS1_CURCL|nr:hypothetical protein yc1106_06898 [Curvularia clavata]